ncbi:MAG: hypothetical protein IJY31_04905 [Muribaculaceae bacterium]|nr:hypothetical protein [Muribaculaceae bacterium]
MGKFRKDRLAALIVTIVFHLLLLVVLCFVSLHYSPAKEEKTQGEILFGGEYVMLGSRAAANGSQDTGTASSANPDKVDESGLDFTDEGASGNPVQPVASEQESPMKVRVEEQPENNGPTKEELARREEERKRQEAARRISSRVKFNSGDANGNGKTGSPDGNAPAGALSGTPGLNLNGRTAESWGAPKSRSLSGKIIVRVRVNRQGHVTSAEYAGGEGPAAANKSVRQSCVQASLDSRFSVDLNALSEQTGTITWHFIE